ncbi:MAG: glycosyltransferase family 4 protein [Acidobacteria bacterium]|nr:glycosyltransferase family 4 protein [Acidobacteriota bacterium]
MHIRSRPARPSETPRSAALLLVGPRVIENDVVGGTKVSFESIIENLRLRANVGLTVVSTSRPRTRRGRLGRAFLDALALVKTLVRTWRHAARADLIVWFVSPRALLLSGGLVWLVCTLRRRRLCIRVCGGSSDVFLCSAPAICRFIAHRTFLRAELLSETRRSAASLGAFCTARWMPNTRDMPPRRQAYRPSCRRLLFLSLLQAEKGLPELLAAAERFPPEVSLSVFGSEMPGFDVADIDRAPHTAYRGAAPPGRVPGILEEHDAIVLPTTHALEGYPGVVIEAFQMGLPVIVSRHASLPELVTEERDGLFVEPGSVDSLAETVVRLCSDDHLFRRLRAGALETGELYRTGRAAAVIEDMCGRAGSASV